MLKRRHHKGAHLSSSAELPHKRPSTSPTNLLSALATRSFEQSTTSLSTISMPHGNLNAQTASRTTPISSGDCNKLPTASSASEHQHINLPSPAEIAPNSPRHHRPHVHLPSPAEIVRAHRRTRGFTSISRHQRRSRQLSGHIRLHVQLPSPAEIATSPPRHHRPANNNTSISRHQRRLQQTLHGNIVLTSISHHQRRL